MADNPIETRAQLMRELEKGLLPPKSPALNLKSLDRLKDKATSSGSAGQLETRRDLVTQLVRIQTTVKLLQASQEKLKELSISNAGVKEALDVFQSESFKSISDKLSSGSDVTSKEGKQLLNSLRFIGARLSDSGVELDQSLAVFVKLTEDFVQNTKVDAQSRRDAISQLIGVAESLGANVSAIAELKGLVQQPEDIKATNAKVTDGLEKIRKESSNKIIKGTLDEHTEQFNKILGGTKNTNALLKKQISATSKLEDVLTDGLHAVGKGGLIGGMAELLSQAAGLPGLGKFISFIALSAIPALMPLIPAIAVAVAAYASKKTYDVLTGPLSKAEDARVKMLSTLVNYSPLGKLFGVSSKPEDIKRNIQKLESSISNLTEMNVTPADLAAKDKSDLVKAIAKIRAMRDTPQAIPVPASNTQKPITNRPHDIDSAHILGIMHGVTD